MKNTEAGDLVADRFLATGGQLVDLATGRRVVMVMGASGDAPSFMRWASRCDRLHRFSHPAVARLVDYGSAGERTRFEAWDGGEVWSRDSGERTRAMHDAQIAFLASGLSAPVDARSDPASASAPVVHACDGRPRVVPGAEWGYECDAGATSTPGTGLVAVGRIVRPELEALAEAFGEPRAGVRIVALWGPRESGVGTAVTELCRVARTNGFVPVAVPCPSPGVRRMLSGRSCLLICRGDSGDGWRGLVGWTIESPRPHVLLFAGTSDHARVDGVALGPVPRERLMASILTTSIDRGLAARIEQLADRSKGLPGRFVSLLWGSRYDLAGRVPDRPSIAAEQPATYGERVSPSDWAGSRDLDGLRRRLDGAVEQVQNGRHAAGIRTLRQTIGALVRRRDWQHAIRGLLALAKALLRRGRSSEAQVVLREAKEHALDRDRHALVAVAVLMGKAWADAGRADEAEAVLHGALAAARAGGDAEQVAESSFALGACLFWRGEYDRVERLLAGLDPSALGPAASIRLDLLHARLAVGRRQHGAAIAGAVRAAEKAERLGDGAVQAEALSALAFVHLAAGDHKAVAREVADLVAAARRTHDPLRALDARLIGAESARRTGSRGELVPVLRRMKRVPPTSLPFTLAARVGLLSDLATEGPAQHANLVRRHQTATGLTSLALYGPDPSEERAAALDRAVGDVLEVLGCCESGADEHSVLADICSRLQTRLAASAVAIFAKGESAPLAASGGRVETEMAERVFAACQTIVPHARGGRIEGGAPVRYAGETIGAIVARWPLGETCDHPRAPATLAMAAGAAGAAVAAALARRTSEAPRPDGDLLGVSEAMAEVRRAIERAAAAPFAVLVEGESGCGKELVARALHRRSHRRDRPFCTLNCAALPEDLVEAELFGHARGAFTGALGERTGIFEEAHGGTLFLDEIGELSPRAQAKILRTIQEGELRRVGENAVRRIDVRLVSATNRNLRQASSAGGFRADLMYRLDVIRITIPPLRDRREDIAALAEHYWRHATERMSSRASLAPATVLALSEHQWPGNVRELQNVLAALAVRAPRRGLVLPEALPAAFRRGPSSEARLRLDAARRVFDEQFVRGALVRTGGCRSRAAAELGLTRQGLTKLITRLGIGP